MKTFQNEMVLSSASSCLGKNDDHLMYLILKLVCRESLTWRKSSSVILKLLFYIFFDGSESLIFIDWTLVFFVLH